MEQAESTKARAFVRRAAEAAGLPEVLSEAETRLYMDFAVFFLRELEKGMQTRAVFGPEMAERGAGAGPRYVVSQRIFGDISLTVGICGQAEVLARLASAYGEMEIEKGDILFIDALMEFLNVINGLYIIERAGDGLHLEIGLPRAGRRIKTGPCLLRLPVRTEVGSMELLLSKYGLL